jgi:hypothetical protein
MIHRSNKFFNVSSLFRGLQHINHSDEEKQKKLKGMGLLLWQLDFCKRDSTLQDYTGLGKPDTQSDNTTYIYTYELYISCMDLYVSYGPALPQGTCGMHGPGSRRAS